MSTRQIQPQFLPKTHHARLALLLRALGAVSSGALLSLAFPPVGMGWLALPAVALLIGVVAQARIWHAAGLTFGAAAVFFLLLLHWLTVVGIDAWILLSLVCACYFALMGAGIAVLSRLPFWPIWVAGMWVAQEWLRGSFPFGGFPWGNLAFAQADTSFGRLSMLTGALGTSGALVLCASAFVALVQAARRGQLTGALGWGATALAIVVLPMFMTPPVTGDLIGGTQSARIAVVQGGTPQTGLGAMDVRRTVLDNHVRHTMLLAAEIARGDQSKPDLVLWPENASDLDPNIDATAAAAIGTSVRAINTPVLVGAIVNVPGDPNSVWNQGILWDPVAGPVWAYSKTHPVPFGEYIPFRSAIAPLIDRFARITRDFAAGDEPGLFNVNGLAIGDVICFEIAYNSVINPLIDGGARVLTVQTNNATYAGTSQPSQQLEIERFRALETGRSVVVAATTGISAFIAPDGSVVRQIPEGEVGSAVEEVALRGAQNPSASLGRPLAGIWALASLGITLFMGLTSMMKRRRTGHKVQR
ncbi:MAG TPA: apolipoprotein N-acyltransferase [Actinobacteria bacterium]|nr:apolipoprotein N-acyltransferase [Actinomycetota bacterium]